LIKTNSKPNINSEPKTNSRPKTKLLTTRRIATIGLLAAINIMLGVTGLGIIFLTPAGVTIMHIPTIVAGILEGPLVGGIVGLIFGGFSMYQAAITPSSPVAPAFLDPLVSVIPRILIGIVSYYVYIGLKKILKKGSISVAAFVGSYTNTILVISAIYFLHPVVLGITERMSMSDAGRFLLTVMGIGSVFEAIAAVILVTLIVMAIQVTRKK